MRYQQMYAILLGACSDAIDAMETWDFKESKKILLSAMQKTEDMYIEQDTAENSSF